MEGQITDDIDRLFTIEQITERTGLSKATIYRLIAKGEFPKPVLAGRRAARWIGAELRAWLDRKLEEREETSVTS